MKFLEYALSEIAITTALVSTSSMRRSLRSLLVICVLKFEENNKKAKRHVSESTDSTDITVPFTIKKQHILRASGHKDYILQFYNDNTFDFVDNSNTLGKGMKIFTYTNKYAAQLR